MDIVDVKVVEGDVQYAGRGPTYGGCGDIRYWEDPLGDAEGQINARVVGSGPYSRGSLGLDYGSCGHDEAALRSASETARPASLSPDHGYQVGVGADKQILSVY